MQQKSDPFREWWATTIASQPEPAEAARPPALPNVQMLVGSVGGNVFIMGEVPKGALNAIFNNRGKQ